MKSLENWLARGTAAFILLGCVAAGCTGSDEGDLGAASGDEEYADGAEELVGAEELAGAEESAGAEELGSLAAGLTSVDDVDCSICAIARSCCHAVNAPIHFCNNFDAEACEALDPGRQRTVKINCLVLLRYAISSWRLAGRTPPAECYIPGE